MTLSGTKILVLGAYGFIGAELTRKFVFDGAGVTGLVRSLRVAQSIIPGVNAIAADIASCRTPSNWRDIVAGFDVVVNAAGALQTGLKDNLDAVHDQSIRALITACEEAGVETFIQISAAGAEASATTQFMQTKARADAALRQSALNWVIFKPGLVIGPNAYGGTSLIRTLASVPVVQPMVLSSARIQCVAIDAVADAVAAAVRGEITMRRDYDLVEDEPRALGDVVLQFRTWLGNARPYASFNLPRWVGGAVALVADAAGWLGWRSPLRSTALRVMDGNVLGDPQPWRMERGAGLKSLDEILAAMPATAQERTYGRVQLIYPLLIAALSLFFVVSGVIGILQFDSAKTVLAGRVSDETAAFLVAGGAILDILLGALIVFRPATRIAALGMVGLSIAYLVSGAVLTPSLWIDPLGPLVKIVPVTALALAAAFFTTDR